MRCKGLLLLLVMVYGLLTCCRWCLVVPGGAWWCLVVPEWWCKI